MFVHTLKPDILRVMGTTDSKHVTLKPDILRVMGTTDSKHVTLKHTIAQS